MRRVNETFARMMTSIAEVSMLPVAAMFQQRAWGAVQCLATPPFLITEINETLAGWTRVDQANAVGLPLAELVPPARGEWIAAITRALGNQSGSQVEQAEDVWPDGQHRQCAIQCLPIYKGDEEQATTVLSLIVERPLEPMVDLDELWLQQVGEAFALLPVPIWLFDAQGHVRTVNQAALDVFDVASVADFIALVGATMKTQFERLQPRSTSPGLIAEVTSRSTRANIQFAEQEMNGTRPPPVTAELRREQTTGLRASELATNRALHRQAVTTNQILSIVHPRDQVELMFDASAAPILNSSGQLIGVISVTIDITKSMLKQGQRDAILAMLGHDLRNPLTPAKFYVQQLRKKMEQHPVFANDVASVDKVLEQLERIQQISVDIDAMAAIMHGGPTLMRPTCDLVALCKELATRQMDRRPEIPVVVETNRSSISGNFARKHLERAMIILIAAAVRRSLPEQPVLVRLRAQAGKVKVEIRDSGRPLTMPQLAALRRVLARGGAALGTTNGSDLDYSIVQTILSLYTSQLLVNSSRLGTTFWFTLALPTTTAEITLPRE